MAGLEGRIFDHYELRSLLGRGGMADVYLGYDPRFERDIAVKVFKRGEDEDLLRRFILEARLMGSLQNSHLIPVYDTGVINLDGYSQYYIVMPYMSGGTLRDRIRGKPLSLAETCRCLSDIADALDYVHSQGIIHRDIKSSNVLLDAEGRCYIADFGIARSSTQATQMTSTGSVLGTVDYIAPELFDGSNHKADVRSDLYSLGVLLFEMVTGQVPFKAENPLAVVTMHMTKQPPLPRSFIPTLPPQVEAAIMKGLEKNPALRFGSAGEMARTFCQAVSGRNPSGEYTGSTVWNNNVADASTVQARPGAPLVLPPTSNIQRAPSYPQTTGIYGNNTNQRQTPQPISYAPQSSYLPQTSYRPQSPYPYPPNQEPPGKRGSIVTLIVLISLLAVLGPVLYVLLTHQHNQANPGTAPIATTTSAAAPSPTLNATATPDTTATAQAMAAAMATQQANATSTALAGTTATAQAQAAATPGVIQTATAGQAVYQDPLTNANNSTTQAEQWDQSNHCTFQADGYHVMSNSSLLNQNGFSGCRESGVQYTNATFSVDVTINKGHSGGLFFYVNTQTLGAYAGYLFEIDTQGNYQIIRSSNFSIGSNAVTLQNSTMTPALKTGTGAKNRLQVIARNGTLLFYINSTFVNQQSDSTFTTGQAAFLATAGQDGQQADVTYSNLDVYQ
jgi:eukaryotic-like serine/threonine-protein kinase